MSRENLIPIVLAAENDRVLAESYRTSLEPTYAVKIAYEREQALDLLDGTVDVVLLDRQMPKLSGDDVAEIIRERKYTCRVAMISASELDVDVCEQGWDEYLVKPVPSDMLCETVERLFQRVSYDNQLQEYFALASRKAAIESQKTADELATDPVYHKVLEQLAIVREHTDATIANLEFRELFCDLDA